RVPAYALYLRPIASNEDGAMVRRIAHKLSGSHIGHIEVTFTFITPLGLPPNDSRIC
uniref:Uncharacterized protein n=1 Tax=Parascaris univalens TaxID=6257 RepID=A0A915BLK1_PARUN